MKAFAIILCVYMVWLASSLPIISKPLDNNPDHLVWEALISIDSHRSDEKTRKIPKSIFITPNLNESKNCPPDHKLGPDGICYKTLQIDPLLMLKKQIESLLKNNRTTTTEYEDDYDYSDYGESTESMNSNGQYTLPLSFGFGGDKQKPQQQQQPEQHTTLPNLNRVVKDDLHISSTINTDGREKQPFRATTTGINLGTEDIIIEQSPESIASVATTSSTIQPITTTSTTGSNSSQNSDKTTNTSESTIVTITKSITDRLMSSSTVENLGSSTEFVDATTVPLTHESNESSSSSSTSVESIETSSVKGIETSSTKSIDAVKILPGDSVDATEKIENTTQPLNTSDENFEKNTETIVLTPTIANVEAIETTQMPSSTDEIESSTIIQAEQSQNFDTITSESSTIIDDPLESSTKITIEPQNESFESERKEKFAREIDEFEQKQEQSTENEKEPSQTEKMVEKLDLIEPSIISMNSKLLSDLITEQPDSSESKLIIDQSSIKPSIIIITTATTTTTTEPDKRLVADNTDSVDVIDASLFMPSQSETPEEIDPAVGKQFNVSVSAPKYRLENATVVFTGDALTEAELAPVIDTGIDGHSNIEFIKTSDELSRAQFNDDKMNLTARLAEELLFEGSKKLKHPNVQLTPNKPAHDKPPTEFQIPIAVVNEPMVKSAEFESKTIDLEEALSGGAVGIGINLGSDSTTEQPVDYDSKEIKQQTETNTNPEIKKNVEYEGDLPSREHIPFVREENLFQLSSSSPSNPVQSTVYSSFIRRLKFAPPFVGLHDHHLETKQSSHTPFEISSSLHSTKHSNRRLTPPETTFPTFKLPDSDRNIDIEPLRTKSLQFGINCYLKSLDKQQYIICDNA